MTDLLSGFVEADLLNQLPASVVRSLNALEANGAPWDATGALLAATPTIGVSLKGGSGWASNLWASVKTEIHSFLCTDSAQYTDLRSEWDKLRQKSSGVALASLSGVIGAQLGTASGVVAPLVIWAFIVVLRIGKNAACTAMAGGQATPAAPATPNP
jgi:hypothetical protein